MPSTLSAATALPSTGLTGTSSNPLASLYGSTGGSPSGSDMMTMLMQIMMMMMSMIGQLFGGGLGASAQSGLSPFDAGSSGNSGASDPTATAGNSGFSDPGNAGNAGSADDSSAGNAGGAANYGSPSPGPAPGNPYYGGYGHYHQYSPQPSPSASPSASYPSPTPAAYPPGGSPTATPSPGGYTPSASPSGSPSASPSGTPSGSPSASPSASGAIAVDGGGPKQLVLKNNNSSAIQVGLFENTGPGMNPDIDNPNNVYTIQPGQQVTLSMPDSWQGRAQKLTGNGSDPATWAELNFEDKNGVNKTWYDESLIRGYNGALTISPTNGDGGTAGSSTPILSGAPSSTLTKDSNGNTVINATEPYSGGVNQDVVDYEDQSVGNTNAYVRNFDNGAVRTSDDNSLTVNFYGD